jgi:hypothetical protein
MFTIRTSLIIPTKDRVVEISHLIRQLNFLKIKFREILVIDSSNDANSKIIKHLCLKNAIKYYKTWASTSHQRNYGLAKIKLSEFIMFMDDDVIFFKKSFYEINKLISNNRNNTQIAGFGFNQTEKIKHNLLEQLKNNVIFNRLNLYSSTPGRVSKSGWHSKILNLKKDTLADWVFTTVCIYKAKDIKNFNFDENFGKYSYLEDLDFSLNLKKKNKKILISHLAKFKHPKNIDRSGLDFGMIEVINRYKIVKKHNLSICLFFIASVTRFILSLIKSLAFNKQYFLRAAGNILGYFRILTNLTKVR